MSLDDLRTLQRLLDNAFRIPGTKLRFGLDPIIGLFPWAGDVLTAVMACALIVHANRLRVPRIIQARMMLNVVIDILVGAVPFVGDVADIFWKANAKNFALIERHSGEAAPPTKADWIFVVGLLGSIVAVAALLLFVVYWIVQSVANALLS